MSKLTFEDLKNLAESVATTDLMEQISGGTSNECHDDPEPITELGTIPYPEEEY